MRSFLLAAAFAVTALARIIPHQSSPKHHAILPSTFSWTSSDVLVTPKNDSRAIAGIKDSSIIHYKGHYHVFASTAQDAGYNLVYFNFTKFEKANEAPFYYLDQSAIGTGYRAAPEVCMSSPDTDTR
jgi:hypothetical protein